MRKGSLDIPTASSHLYRAAARVLAATVFNAPFIESVCVRRSVASGEAVFPFSDLDLDITLTEDAGPQILALRRRLQLARVLFPRTGQCFVLAPGELEELAATEPYRASINRRCGLPVRGPMPHWPAAAIDRLEAARRVVFWLDHYFPWAIRASHARHQRKFYLEMANALGLLEGRWPEPHIRLRDVETHLPANLFPAALQLAATAQALLRRPAPRLTQPVFLPGLTILPSPQSPWPVSTQGPVLTPEALDLLLQTHSPALWLPHAEPLASLDFQPPSPWTWARFARRSASPLWLRGPGFFESHTGPAQHRIRLAQHVLDAVETGVAPVPLPTQAPPPVSVSDYYRKYYPRLSSLAATLRARAIAVEHRTTPPGYT